MGIFDMFSKKSAPEVVSKNPTPEIIDGDLEKANQISGFAKYQAPSRLARIASKFGIKPKEIHPVDRTMETYGHPPAAKLKQVYVDDQQEKDKAEAVKKQEQALRDYIRSHYKDKTSAEIRAAMEEKDRLEIAANYNGLDPVIYGQKIDQREAGQRFAVEADELKKLLAEVVATENAVDVYVPEVADIKVVNTDAVPAAQKPLEPAVTNENFVNDAFKLEMQRRDVTDSIRGTYIKSLPEGIDKAIKMRQKSLQSLSQDGEGREKAKVLKIEIEELQKILSEIPTLTEQIKPESKKEKLDALMAKWKPRLNSNFDKLKGFGVKSLDWHKDLSTKNKVLFGAAMGGLGILSGGVTTVASKSFAVTRAIRSSYEREVKRIKNGIERELDTTEKRKAILKCAAIGLLIGGVGFGISEVLESLGDVVPEEVLSDVKSSVESVKEIKPLTEGVDTDVMPHFEAEAPTGAVEAVASNVEVATDYVVQKGESLEKLLLEKAFGGDMPKGERLTEIYNMFASPEGKALLAESGIKDINKIEVGKHINLKKFYDLLN